MKRAKRQSPGAHSESDALSVPPILKGLTMVEFRAAEAAVEAGTATPEQDELVRAEAEFTLKQLAAALAPVAPRFIQADSHAREILARMRSDGLQGFWEYIKANPPDGLTVLAVVRHATAKDSEAAQRILKDARQEQTSNARQIRAKNAVMRDGRDWRESAREIAKGDDPNTSKPWRTKELLIKYLMENNHKSRSAVIRALNPKK